MNLGFLSNKNSKQKSKENQNEEIIKKYDAPPPFKKFPELSSTLDG